MTKFQDYTYHILSSILQAPVTIMSKGIFTGVVVTSIRLETLGNFLKDQLFPQFNSTIGLLDKNGTILYATGAQQYAGENIFGNKFQSALSSLLHSPESKEWLK